MLPKRRSGPRIAGWVACALPLLTHAAPAAAGPREEAVARARDLALAQSLPWRRLVHYRSGTWGGQVSDVDGDAFFLARGGKHDPEAEIEATLNAFFRPVVPGDEDAHALCRFPARRLWLDEELHFMSHIRAPTCPALARYHAALDPKSVTFVYSANFLSNPASAFGHTFLRIDSLRPSGADGRRNHLDFAVDFAATTDTRNPFVYAFKGLTGMFPGRFQFHYFDDKVLQYNDYEERDLWEYDLALSPGEVMLLALHLWELSATYIDYFYLTGNCSYHVLAALEAAAPRLDLLTHVKAVVLPGDTLKAIFATPGLVRAVRYRPSTHNRLRAQIPASKAPERGHGTMRVDLGIGATSLAKGSFGTVGYRLALHDLADPPDGEPELSQVQFLDTHLRYGLTQRSLTLDNITFAELMALNPLTRSEKLLSWRGRAVGLHVHDRGCPASDCFAHGLDAAVGATLATRDERVAFFFMGDAFVLFSPAIDGVLGSFVRLGIGPYGGLRLRLPSRTIALVTATFSYLPAQNLRATGDVRAVLRTALGKDVALGIDATIQPSSVEAELRSYLYF